MTTIKEDYVSFETAKLLKEKGFQQLQNDSGYFTTEMVYGINVDKNGEHHFAHQYPIGVYNKDKYIAAPTLQMAMKWLREVHGLFVSIGNDDLDYNWQIFDINDRTKDLDPTCLTESYAGYRKYEQACEAAIKYCLKNLIK